MDQSACLRRAAFILAEAKAGGVRDVAVNFAMRSITDFHCAATKGTPRVIQKAAKLRSEAAHAILQNAPNGDTKQLRNEHPEELRDVWQWVTTNKKTLTKEQVFERLCEWPIVVVTAAEHSDLNRLRKESLAPEERYKRAGIKLLRLNERTGKWRPTKALKP